MQVTFNDVFLLVSLCPSFFFLLYLFHILLPLFYSYLFFLTLFSLLCHSSRFFLDFPPYSVYFLTSLFHELFPFNCQFQLTLHSKRRRIFFAFGAISIRLPARTSPNLRAVTVFFRHTSIVSFHFDTH
jgi:hypothetical protein